jgi:pyruvate/2-oxoglutarate dehydrogenase complex dihydrolipoamide acyltransferase (E2) component
MLSMGMTEGTIAEWLYEDGVEVKEGTPIYAVETDKSVHEVEAPVSGILRIIAPIGEVYPVGTLVGKIE